MDAVTYPEPNVVRFVTEHFIPLRVPFNAEPYASEFNVKWTPTIVTLDSNGNEHFRTLGFLSSEDLIASLYLGIGKASFDTENLSEALEYFDDLLAEYPKSEFAPEGIYLKGVSQYKSTDDPMPLKAAYEELSAKYPGNEWTKRAFPYRLIQ